MNKKKKKVKIFSLTLILIGLLYFNYKLFIIIKTSKIEEEELTIYFKQYENLGNEIEKVTSPFLMVLEIPKINIKQGIYSKNDTRNIIDKNISILSESIKIDHEKSLLILAAHSGNSIYSYFRNLDKLRLNDIIIIYYEGHKYTYKINKIYEMSKTIAFKLPDIKNNKIILITCLNDATYLIIEALNT